VCEEERNGESRKSDLCKDRIEGYRWRVLHCQLIIFPDDRPPGALFTRTLGLAALALVVADAACCLLSLLLSFCGICLRPFPWCDEALSSPPPKRMLPTLDPPHGALCRRMDELAAGGALPPD